MGHPILMQCSRAEWSPPLYGLSRGGPSVGSYRRDSPKSIRGYFVGRRVREYRLAFRVAAVDLDGVKRLRIHYSFGPVAIPL